MSKSANHFKTIKWNWVWGSMGNWGSGPNYQLECSYWRIFWSDNFTKLHLCTVARQNRSIDKTICKPLWCFWDGMISCLTKYFEGAEALLEQNCTSANLLVLNFIFHLWLHSSMLLRSCRKSSVSWPFLITLYCITGYFCGPKNNVISKI